MVINYAVGLFTGRQFRKRKVDSDLKRRIKLQQETLLLSSFPSPLLPSFSAFAFCLAL